MGVALYIQGYEKKEECISGQIKILGWFEVDTNKIENHKISNSSTVLHDDLESIKLVESQFYNYGFEDPSELSFYSNVMNGMTGGGYRTENDISYGLMFDGKRILNIITKIIENLEHIPLENNSQADEGSNLNEFQKVLKVIAEKDGIVGIMWG